MKDLFKSVSLVAMMISCGVAFSQGFAHAESNDVDQLRKAHILARYSSGYRGDDNLFADCLISDDGSVTILFQNNWPEAVFKPKVFSASKKAMAELSRRLSQVTADEKHNGALFYSENGTPSLQVFPLSDSTKGNLRGWYQSVDENSPLALVIKRICKL